MPWRQIAEWLGFQCVWIVCALSAAQGRNLPGIAAAALYIGLVLAQRRPARADLLAITASGLAGLAAESLLAATGLVRFSAPWPSASFAPAWMVALWLAFGATLSIMRAWLGERFRLKAAIFGAIGGPLAYWAGARLGALEVSGGATAYLAIAAMWALALPALLALTERPNSDKRVNQQIAGS